MRAALVTRMRVGLGVVGVVGVASLGAAGEAWALKPAKHRELAERACHDAGLPDAFCRRIGKQVFETDYLEWTDLAAHAQRAAGEDRCTAADAALARVGTLARDAIADVRAGSHEQAAIDLGRALHTIQDECAHHGMSNEEHAFLSMRQTCEGENVSPDTQPAALACAERQTRVVMQAAATALAGTHWPNDLYMICRDDDNADSCSRASLPSPLMACDFLALHDDYDGEDSTWHAQLVGEALVAAFRAGLAGESSTRTACANGPSSIDPTSPHASESSEQPGCSLVSIGCLGKADTDGNVDPYGEDISATGGCSTTSGNAGLLIGLLAFVPRRRRPSRTAAKGVRHLQP
jgi:hypothetical protein